jgi:hypothetical protein
LILSAEGRQQAALRDAEARVALARAEAEATQMVSDAAAQHGQAGLRYFIADRYVRAFQALASAPNTRLVVVPMESAALAGGIVQAMQLFRSGDDGPSAGGPTNMPPPPPAPHPPTPPPPLPPLPMVPPLASTPSPGPWGTGTSG